MDTRDALIHFAAAALAGGLADPDTAGELISDIADTAWRIAGRMHAEGVSLGHLDPLPSSEEDWHGVERIDHKPETPEPEWENPKSEPPAGMGE